MFIRIRFLKLCDQLLRMIAILLSQHLHDGILRHVLLVRNTGTKSELTKYATNQYRNGLRMLGKAHLSRVAYIEFIRHRIAANVFPLHCERWRNFIISCS
ncbi:hypothetical protein D3C78_1352750 [compost metagenome]